MKLIIIALSALLITSCTTVWFKDKDGEKSLFVFDLHPGGESISLAGTLEDKGTLDVNREQGSNAAIIDSIGDAVKPGISLP